MLFYVMMQKVITYDAKIPMMQNVITLNANLTNMILHVYRF